MIFPYAYNVYYKYTEQCAQSQGTLKQDARICIYSVYLCLVIDSFFKKLFTLTLHNIVLFTMKRILTI